MRTGKLQNFVAMPPEPCPYPANHISNDVPRVTGSPFHNVRSDNLEQDGPDKAIETELANGWHVVIVPELEQALKPQQRRQRARYQQHIIEMIPKKWTVNAGNDYPAVQRVETAGQDEQAIEYVSEPLHSSARITKPNPIAKANFSNKIIPII